MARPADYETLAETENFVAQYKARKNQIIIWQNEDFIAARYDYKEGDFAQRMCESKQRAYESRLKKAQEEKTVEDTEKESPKAHIEEVNTKQVEEPATPKQISFIIKLLREDRHEGCWYGGNRDLETISKKEASQFISAMLEA